MATRLLTKSIRNHSRENLIQCFRMSSFKALGINEVLVNRLAKLGIEKPTEIQEKTLSVVLEGRNTIINSETGSGKTLCYLLPIVNELINNPFLLTKPPHAVILLPTIELCHQVASVYKSIADPHMHPCIVSRESKLLIHSNYPVVMAMPSALLSYDLNILSNVKVVITDEADFLTTSGGKDVWTLLNFLKHGRQRKKKRHSTGSSAVIPQHKDCDNISNKSDFNGSQTQLNPTSNRQFVFVAATLPSKGKKASRNVLTKWLPDANIATTSIVHQKLPTLDMVYVKVAEETKLPQLLRYLNGFLGGKENEIGSEEMDNNKVGLNGKLLNENTTENLASKGNVQRLRVLVFANTAHQASSAFRYLTDGENQEANEMQSADQSAAVNQNIEGQRLNNENMMNTGSNTHWRGKCGELHKDVPIEKRLEALERFKAGELNVLVCTDIASRGLDVPDVSHVIQLDFASNAATVLHRTGRTARAGSQGKVINFVTPKDEDLARALRSCDDDANNMNYEAIFSRNRMFRRRMKRSVLPLADAM